MSTTLPGKIRTLFTLPLSPSYEKELLMRMSADDEAAFTEVYHHYWKLLFSVAANKLDRKRTLCETYGGSGCQLTFKEMKRLGDWQYALGVNFMNQHLSLMTLTGTRKYDYPQIFSYHSPWWNHYGTLNHYFTRLSLALSSGQQRNKILIIEPTTTAWMYSVYSKISTHRDTIGLEMHGGWINRLAYCA